MPRSHWASRASFVLAASGSAVGLGNIWKFPYITGENGGGAFVLVYLACIALVGLPILLAEIHLGRTAQCSVSGVFQRLHHPRSPWRAVGVLALLSAVLVLGFYSVVGGWVLDFTFKAATGALTTGSDDAVSHSLDGLLASAGRLIVWQSLFMGLTVLIVLRGVSAGIERAARVLMPGLLLLLLVLLGRVAFMSGFEPALGYLLRPDFGALSADSILVAVGHAFFTLSLATGTMMTYGSYLPAGQAIGRTTLLLGLIDTLVALTAGVVVFSVVFSFAQAPEAGPGLMFVTLPLLFKQLGAGQLVATAFFVLVAFAALTSSISMLEVPVAWASERIQWSRRRATLCCGAVIYALGVLCALSFNLLQDWRLAGRGVFDLMDGLSSLVTMPLGGLLVALFFGWVLGPRAVEQALGPDAGPALRWLLLWSVRLIAPLAVGVVLFTGLTTG